MVAKAARRVIASLEKGKAARVQAQIADYRSFMCDIATDPMKQAEYKRKLTHDLGKRTSLPPTIIHKKLVVAKERYRSVQTLVNVDCSQGTARTPERIAKELRKEKGAQNYARNCVQLGLMFWKIDQTSKVPMCVLLEEGIHKDLRKAVTITQGCDEKENMSGTQPKRKSTSATASSADGAEPPAQNRNPLANVWLYLVFS